MTTTYAPTRRDERPESAAVRPPVPALQGVLASGAGPGLAGPAAITHLQRTAGNAAVVALMRQTSGGGGPSGCAAPPAPLGRGTRASPKLKDESAPGGALCRGACGPDCPSTCTTIGTYSRTITDSSGCSWTVTYPNAIRCGTHAGCRSHDACYDGCERGGESDLCHHGGSCHCGCDWDAVRAHGVRNTYSWKDGGGPFDGHWIFVDPPVVTPVAPPTPVPTPPPAPGPTGPVVGTVTARPSLRVRERPTTQSPKIGNYAFGTEVAITCSTTGEEILGNAKWDRTDLGYISDRYIDRGTATPAPC